MAQRAFVRVASVDPGDTRNPNVIITCNVTWYGDSLSGDETMNFTLAKTSTANQINTAITNQIIARVSQRSSETMTSSDILFIDRFV